MSEVPIALIVLLVVGAALLLTTVYFTIYRQRAWKHLNATHVAYFFFGAGSLAFWFAIFPPGLSHPDEAAGVLPIGLAIAAVLFTPTFGLIFHQLYMGRRPLTQSNLPILVAMFAGFGLFSWSDFEKEHGGAYQHVESQIASIVTILGILVVGVVVVSVLAVWLYSRFSRGHQRD